MTILEKDFANRKGISTDINEHMDVLRTIGSKCSHITEFGFRTGNSASAFIASSPDEFHTYDIVETREVSYMKAMCEEVSQRFEFHLADTRTCEIIAPTDMLFIDTEHEYKQVQAELSRHAHQVRKYLVFHDTTTFPGLYSGIKDWLKDHPEWAVLKQYTHNNGLLILNRIGD